MALINDDSMKIFVQFSAIPDKERYKKLQRLATDEKKQTNNDK